MKLTQNRTQTLEHVAVTFFEAVIAYVLVVPSIQLSKGLLVGAIGAGLSAVYNLLRQSTPPSTPNVTSEPTG